MRPAPLCLLIREDEVLLAIKKRGFGVGRWNGMGGKLEPGEDLVQGVIREVGEEVGVERRSRDVSVRKTGKGVGTISDALRSFYI